MQNNAECSNSNVIEGSAATSKSNPSCKSYNTDMVLLCPLAGGGFRLACLDDVMEARNLGFYSILPGKERVSYLVVRGT